VDVGVVTMLIDPNDICSLEPSDRVGWWELTLWHPSDETKIVLDLIGERQKATGEEKARQIAATIAAWTAG
jgi:hypothetical protein